MKTAVQCFLRKGFETLFTSYRSEWIDLGVAMAEEARELFISDVEVKFPQFSQAPDRDAALARILDTDASLDGILLYRASHALFSILLQSPACGETCQRGSSRPSRFIFSKRAVRMAL